MTPSSNSGVKASQSPHRMLWCSVLLQALDDATGKAGMTTMEEIEEARDWLTRKRNKWRQTVCDFAGVNEECLTKKARELYA